MSAALRVAIVGLAGGTNVGDSLRRAALAVGHEVLFLDSATAKARSRLEHAILWRFDRLPKYLHRFSADAVRQCAAFRPSVLIATGSAPLTGQALDALRSLGVATINFSTDDPWNRVLRARWHLRALPHYAAVFTPRKANLEDFRKLECVNTHYLPFGYDEHLCEGPFAPVTVSDVLFVGGGDRDRLTFMTDFMGTGAPVALVGGYWDRFAATKPHALGLRNAEDVCALTAAAKINLCLVRRANRDGHVMRSLEMAAIGACMLVEDTSEHRELFGEDNVCVCYFKTAREAGALARALLADDLRRQRLSRAVRARIRDSAHSYRHRLDAMIAVGASLRLSPRADAPNVQRVGAGAP
jgi:hypothetical protein